MKATAPEATSMWTAKLDGVVVETGPSIPSLLAFLKAEHGPGIFRTDGRGLVFTTIGESSLTFVIEPWVGRK